MKLTAAVVDAMLAAGATAEVFAAAFRAAAAEDEARADAKRAATAERQRRFKARRKAETESNAGNALPDVTTPFDGPPDEKSNPPFNPPVQEDEEEGVRAAEREVHASIVAEWNVMAAEVGLRRAAKLTDERRGRIRARLAEHGREAFTEAIARIAGSPWCNGDNDRGWTADFDFLLQPSSFLKVIEGKYDRQQPSPARQHRPSPSRGGGGGFARRHIAKHYAPSVG